MVYMRSLPDNAFDLAIVDPPYGINASSKGRLNRGAGKLKNCILNQSDFGWDDCTPKQEYFVELFRVSKNQIIWGGNYFDLPPTRGIICWDKQQSWENFSQVELAWTSFDKPAKIFRHPNTSALNKEIKIHPTQKPVRLYEWLLRTYAKDGWRVLDTHLGSQSSRIACFRAGLEFWGTEIDRTYFTVGNNRFESEVQQLRLIL